MITGHAFGLVYITVLLHHIQCTWDVNVEWLLQDCDMTLAHKSHNKSAVIQIWYVTGNLVHDCLFRLALKMIIFISILTKPRRDANGLSSFAPNRHFLQNANGMKCLFNNLICFIY